MRVALYIRVSTAVQFEKGNSVPEQKKRLQAYCEARGWNQYDFFIDPGHSGSNMDRPGLQKLIRNVKNYSLVLVYKLDRLSRNQRDILYLIEDVFNKNGVEFNSITENFDTSTPVGKLMLSMMGAFAELERQQINERMMMGRIASAEKGNWRGGSGVPFGYRYISRSKGGSGSLTIDDFEASMVRKAFDLFELGYSFGGIRTELNNCGMSTSSAYVIHQMLMNPVYIGMIRYAGETYQGHHEPIIALAQFERVQALLSQKEPPKRKEKHLLTGFLNCSCGSRVCFHSTKQPNGKKYDYYECYTRNCHKTMAKALKCKNKIWRAADLEEVVWNVLEELDYDEVSAPVDHSKEEKALKKELKKIDGQIERLIELYSLEGIPQELLSKQLNELNQKKDTIRSKIDALMEEPVLLTKEEVQKKKKSLASIKRSDLATQRAFLATMIDSITLFPGHDLEFHWKF